MELRVQYRVDNCSSVAVTILKATLLLLSHNKDGNTVQVQIPEDRIVKERLKSATDPKWQGPLRRQVDVLIWRTHRRRESLRNSIVAARRGRMRLRIYSWMGLYRNEVDSNAEPVYKFQGFTKIKRISRITNLHSSRKKEENKRNVSGDRTRSLQWVNEMYAREVFISGDIIQQKGGKLLDEVNLKLPEEKISLICL